MAQAKETTLAGLGSLLKLLPTGTVFTFEFLNPVLSNDGRCRLVHKYLTSILIALCGLSCLISSFTDSYKGKDGKTHYAFVTCNGLWPTPSKEDDSVKMEDYKMRIGDIVRASLALAVFAVLALLNPNVVRCFYPTFEVDGEKILKALPPVIGALSGFVFVVFPNERNGIGYPSTSK
ncbi:protein DMP2-like [Impatiens glandulifera]|uniref:protein DMP2-like n=1 Tax=Impatiens glandulifera TaxID=253017 RepID=UPI001FB0E9E4|nr:protein DMP2-like [Impatiens glandulifera]